MADESARARLIGAVTRRGQEYEALRLSLEPQIAKLKAEADKLADEFRELFRQASESYDSGNRALAKQLSLQGKAAQATCEEANAEVGRLLARLQHAQTALQQAETELRALSKSTANRKPAAQSATVQLVGLQRQYGISEALVGQVLGAIAPAILARLRRVEYVSTLQPDHAVGRTTSKEKDPARAVIFLYPCVSTLDVRELERIYRDTLVHECGHVLFDRIMSVEQRWAWGDIFNRTQREGGSFITRRASETLREDFGECFMYFLRRPQVLYSKVPERYAFINKVYKELR